MADDMGEKTEAPSQRKITEARDRGTVAKSVDLSASLDLLGAVALIWFLGPMLMSGCAEIMMRLLSSPDPSETISQEGTLKVFTWAMVRGAMLSAPLMLAMFAIAFIVQIHQVKLHFTLQPLQPKFDRLNPVNGMQRLFSRRNAVKTLVSVAKMSVVIAVAERVIAANWHSVVALPSLGAVEGFTALFGLVMKVSLWVLGTLVLIGVADWWYQKWQHTQDLKMTKHEVKEERKMMDGDPEVRARRMKIAREIAMQRAKNAVPQADVVVTNPTHFSVALKYDAETMAAPTVVAKGEDFMAFRIREIAAQHGVPIIERPPLARALYAGVKVGQQVRPELFEAVAEVLAYVYRLEKQKAG